MKKLRHILGLILVCFAFALIAPATAEAAEVSYAVTGGNLYFDDSTGEIFGCDKFVTKAVIPSKINGVAVTSIASDAFRYCCELVSVTIPDSVTNIDDWTFYSCTSLTSVTIPDSVTHIGDYAFSGCVSLANITIPNNVVSIGEEAFSDCTSLESVEIPDRVASIGAYAFYNCTNLASVEIPDSVTSIEAYAFSGCTSLTNVTIPGSVTSISYSMFSNCTGLKSVEVPGSVTSIGNYAFSGCTNITSVTIPNSVTSIEAYAFSDCESLTSITIPDSVTSIGNYAFSGCTSLTSVTIPGSVTRIGHYMFSGCTSLERVTLHSGVTEIFMYAFAGCTNLTSVTFPDSMTYIGGFAFSGCTALTTVYYGGDSEQWDMVFISSDNDPLESAKIVFGYEAEEDALEAPTLTVSKTSAGKPYLSWSAVSGATKYEVYSSADGKSFSKLIATTGRTLTHSSAKAGTTYYYKVCAINATTAGEFSAVKSVSVAASLAAPSVAITNNSAGKPYLTWTAVTGATKYEVYSSTDGTNFTKLITTTGKVLTHNSAKIGTTYYYKVRAINSTTSGTFSSARKITCTLAAPTVTITANSNGKPYLSWSAVTGATKYEVYYSTDGVNFSKLIATTGRTLTHSSAKTGMIYYYKVRGINATINGTFSSVKNMTVAAAGLTAPTLTASKNSAGKPYLSWTAVTGATKYEVYYSTDGTNFSKLITTTGTVLTHSSAKGGTVYDYKVRAINATTTGAFSSVKRVVASLAAPTVTITSNSKGKPYLAWTAVSGAAEYEVYYSTDGVNFSKLIATTGRTLTHSSAKSGTTYTYKVRAINSTRTGVYSKTVTLTAK